jgi:type IV secretion system protein VirB3
MPESINETDRPGAAPLHRALIEPVFLGGIPRNVAIMMWGTAAGVAVTLWSLWLIPIACLLHAVLAVLFWFDPDIHLVLARAYWLTERLEP